MGNISEEEFEIQEEELLLKIQALEEEAAETNLNLLSRIFLYFPRSELAIFPTL